MVDININMGETQARPTLPHYKNPNYQKEYRALHREERDAYMREYNKTYYIKNRDRLLLKNRNRQQVRRAPATAPAPVPAPAPAPASSNQMTINITRGTESIIIHF